MSAPIDIGLSGTGFLDGELLRDTGAMSSTPSATNASRDETRDEAPDGAADLAFGRGADFLIKTCKPIPVGTILELDPVVGQYTDEVTLTARLRDDAGEPLSGTTVTLELDDTTHTASTDPTGRARVPVTLTMEPGTYQLTASFAGVEGYEPSTSSSHVTVEREKSKLTMSVTRKRAFRILKARVVDADSGSPIAGIKVKLYRGATLLKTVTTGERGWATLWHRPSGTARGQYRASFGGTSSWTPSKDTASG
jgi:5-hydroxyisourate hydrolase-like protein (transthyretin family)